MNVPNLITCGRLFSTFFIVGFILKGYYSHALTVFLFAALSDIVDGFLARRSPGRSSLGSYLDPLADKVLLMGVFLALTFEKKIPEWLTFLVLFRDIFLLIGTGFLFYFGKFSSLSPSVISKINTMLQMLLIIVCLSNISSPILDFLIYSSALTTCLSGFLYGYGGWKILRPKNKYS